MPVKCLLKARNTVHAILLGLRNCDSLKLGGLLFHAANDNTE